MLVKLIRLATIAAAACTAAALPAHAQANWRCDAAKRDWAQFGANAYLGNFGAMASNDSERAAARFLATPNYASRVAAQCTAADAPPFNEAAISSAVRAAAKGFMWCAQLQKPLERITFLRDYVKAERAKTLAAVTGLEISGFELNIAEHDFWALRLEDLKTNAECAQAAQVAKHEPILAAAKADLDWFGQRILTARTACETSYKAYLEGAQAVIPQASNVAAALQARDALKPKLTAANTACNAFGADGTKPIVEIEQTIDIELAAAVPICKTVIDKAETAYQAATKAMQSNMSSQIRAARDNMNKIALEAAQTCRNYPGLARRFDAAAGQLSLAMTGAK